MYVADFHIHSKYSRATSKNMKIEQLSIWAKYKGINLIGTGDITHFLWFHQLKEKLKETDREGIFEFNGTDFILTGEVSNIYEKNGRVRKIHNIIFVPSFESGEKLNRVLERYGDLNVDGRPILQMSSDELVKVIKEIDENIFVVPAHIWTPHFSLFGSNSGFDNIEECFENFTSEIIALETGLSSDPEMNWRLSSLDRFTLISNSDAHSPQKIGREANIFKDKFNFFQLKEILRKKDKEKFLFTVEYFPEEGKYHYDGHRNCKVCFSPEETIKNNGICPVCGRKITVGVMHRVEELADRKAGRKPENFIPFKKLVPLDQIIGNVIGKPVDSPSVKEIYLDIVNRVAPEFSIFFDVPEEELQKKVEKDIFEGIKKIKEGEVNIQTGYDGEFGKIEIQIERSKVKDEPSLF